jgi:hypothetical protein
MERVGAAIGVAKQPEDARPRLPPPPRQITQEKPPLPKPTPKQTDSRKGFDKTLDEEIPF